MVNIKLDDKELKKASKIIEKYDLKKYLEDNNIRGLYEGTFESLFEISLISQLLYSANIYPLNYLNYIPAGFLTDCNKIQSFTIPNHIKTIENKAFANCNKLTRVIIPDSVINIGNYAFSSSMYLSNISIGNNVTRIGGYAFYNTSVSSIVVPDSVTTIGEHAFYNTELEHLELSKGIEDIGDGAFVHTKLKSINYAGTIEDWNKINLKGKVFLKMTKSVICSDGVIEL